VRRAGLSSRMSATSSVLCVCVCVCVCVLGVRWWDGRKGRGGDGGGADCVPKCLYLLTYTHTHTHTHTHTPTIVIGLDCLQEAHLVVFLHLCRLRRRCQRGRGKGAPSCRGPVCVCVCEEMVLVRDEIDRANRHLCMHASHTHTHTHSTI
jgi:hypothetical protein